MLMSYSCSGNEWDGLLDDYETHIDDIRDYYDDVKDGDLSAMADLEQSLDEAGIIEKK